MYLQQQRQCGLRVRARRNHAALDAAADTARRRRVRLRLVGSAERGYGTDRSACGESGVPIRPAARAYVYVRGATTPPWTLAAAVDAIRPIRRGFGWSVALSGNTAVVGDDPRDRRPTCLRAAVVSGRSNRNSPGPTPRVVTTSALPSRSAEIPCLSERPINRSDRTLNQGAAYVFITSGPPGPLAVPVTPNTGSGFGPQTFTAVYTDPNGASDLQVVYLDIANFAWGSLQLLRRVCAGHQFPVSVQRHEQRDSGTDYSRLQHDRIE